MSVAELMDELAAETPAPGGGSGAALALTMAAGLAAMAGRFSSAHLEAAGVLAEQADALRARATPLAEADGAAYGAVLRAYALPRGKDVEAQAVRAAAIKQALSDAADVPLTVAEISVEVARVASRLFREGNPNLKGDAGTSVILAAASARAAALLVAINLAGEDDDPRPARAAMLSEEAEHLAAIAARPDS